MERKYKNQGGNGATVMPGQCQKTQDDTIWSAPGRKTKHFPGGPESVPAESKGVARSHNLVPARPRQSAALPIPPNVTM